MTRQQRSWVAAGVVLAVLLVLIRAILPVWVANAVNSRLAEMGDYHGQVDEVDLAIYRGAYRARALRIEKIDGNVAAPLLDVPELELSIHWRALLRGSIVGEVTLMSPELNFVDGGDEGEDQAGTGVDWRERLESLFPFHIDKIEVVDGVITFRSPSRRPPVDVRLEDVQANLENLTNVRDAEGRRDAALDLRALMLGQAPLEVDARFDPFGVLGDFSLNVRVSGVELTRLNPLARAYAALDFASGTGDFVLELEASDGQLDGYVVASEESPTF